MYPTFFQPLIASDRVIVLIGSEDVTKRLARPGVLEFREWLDSLLDDGKSIVTELQRRWLVCSLLTETPLNLTPSLARSSARLESFLEEILWSEPDLKLIPKEGLEWLDSYSEKLSELGLWDLPRATTELTRRASKLTWSEGEIVWVATQALGPRRQELFDALKQSGLNIRLEGPSLLSGQSHPSRHLGSFEEVLCYCAEWGIDGESRSLVVTESTDHAPWLRTVSHAKNELPWAEGEGRDFVLAESSTIDDAPILNTALNTLGLLRTQPLFSDWSQVLRSSALNFSSTEATNLETRMRDRGHFRLSLEQALELSQERSALLVVSEWIRTLQDVSSARSSVLNPAQWASLFKDFLSAAGWPKSQTGPGREAQMVTFSRALENFVQLEVTALDLEQALLWLREALRQEWRTRPLRDTQLVVAGPGLAQWLRPDRTLLLDPDSYSQTVDEAFADWRPSVLRVRARQNQWARLNQLRALSSSVEQVTWTRSLPGADNEQSSALSKMLWKTEREKFGESPLEAWEDESLPVLKDEEIRGGAKIFSLQAKCPFRAMAEIRLRAKPLDRVGLGLNARARGELVHACFEEFWKTRRDPGILGEVEALELQTELEKAVALAIQEAARKYPWELSSEKASLESLRLSRLLAEGVSWDLGRSPFQIEALEKSVKMSQFGFPVKMRVDRIDRLPDGRLLVIDYKTGRPSVQTWEGERPEEPQLPLYCLTLGDEVAGLAFFSLRPNKVTLIGFGPEQDSGMKRLSADLWKEKCQNWNQALTNLAESFKSGQAQVDPKSFPTTCRYCGLGTLCRVAELRRQ